jgi:enoyl-CoA hydratase/carnithine racemase
MTTSSTQGSAAPAALVLSGAPAEGVLLLTLNRPHKLNALSPALLEELRVLLVSAEADASVRCVVLTGTGKAFCAGADIGDMIERGMEAYLDPQKLAGLAAVESFPKPIIAAVNGYTLGGGLELAMLCDFIIASEAAVFGQPEINIAAFPGDGGTQRLPRFVGKALAMKMILTGESIDAREAERVGLVQGLAAPDELLARATEVARRIAAKAPHALRLAKQAVQKVYEVPLSAGLKFEQEATRQVFATEDRAEGLRAYTEKRAPRYAGR